MNSTKHHQNQKSQLQHDIQITQDIFNSYQIQEKPNISIDSISKFCHDKIECPINCTMDQIISICKLNFNDRFSLIKNICNFFEQNDLEQTDTIYLSNLILQSSCGLLFWDFTEIDQNSFISFSNALLFSIPNSKNLNHFFIRFFASLSNKIFSFVDIDLSIQSLILISKIIDKHPKLIKKSMKGIIEFLIRIFHRLENKCQLSVYRIISNFIQSISNPISEINDVDNPEINELIKLILKQVLVPTPIELLLSYLSLLLSFNVHDSDLFPLLDKITREFELEIKPSIKQSEFVEKTEISIQFFNDLSDLQIEEPNIPNLSSYSSKFIQQASTELVNHFEKLSINIFLSFIKLLLTSNNPNFQAFVILIILNTNTSIDYIATDFIKNDYLELLFNLNTGLFDISDQKIISFHKSVFELMNFLSIDANFQLYSRKKLCLIFNEVQQAPQVAATILYLSLTYCPSLYDIENNDHLFDHIFNIISYNKDFKGEDITLYKKLFLVTLIKIFQVKNSMISILKSQFSCDMFVLLLLIKPIENISEHMRYVIRHVIQIISEEEVDYQLFTNSIQKILKNNEKKISILKLIRLFEQNPTPILLKSKLIKDFIDILFRIKDKDFLVKIITPLLHIIDVLKNYYEFDHDLIPFGKIGTIIGKLNMADSLLTIMNRIVFNDDFIILPEALTMILNSLEGSTKQIEFIDFLTTLCSKSIFNRSACILGSISKIKNEQFSYSFFNLLKVIFSSFSDANSLWAFFKCFESEEHILFGINSLIEIVKHSSKNAKPFFQISSPFSRVVLPSINLSSFINGIHISVNIYIENEHLNRNLIQMKSETGSDFILSLKDNSLVYLDQKFPLSLPTNEWFKIELVINPNHGFLVFINNEKKIEFTQSIPFDDCQYEFVMFNQIENAQPFYLSNVSLSTDFGQNMSPELIKQHRLCRLSAESIYEGSVVNKPSIRIDNASLLPVVSTFLHVFETTQCLQFILLLFNSIQNNPLLFDNLIQLLFILMKKSSVIIPQMIEFNGFAIIEHFLSKMDHSELTTEHWRNLINGVKPIKNEKLLKQFAYNIFYNPELLSKATSNVQYQVLFDWNRMGLFVDLYQTVPFLLSVYELFIDESPIEVKSEQEHIIYDEPEFTPKEPRERTQSVISCKPCSVPIPNVDDLYQSGRRLSSSSLYNFDENESKTVNVTMIRNIIITMLKNAISRQKVTSKDVRFLYQTIHKCKTSETVLELIDLIESFYDENIEEFMAIDGNEWIPLFVHPNENVKVKWLSLFASVYPLPSPEVTKSIILMILVNSQGKLRDDTSSETSILAACCRASLCVKLKIKLDKVLNKQILCASPSYFYIAMAYSFTIPQQLSNVFRQFVISICKFPDNVKRIAESLTPLTMLVMIYWALKRSFHSENDNSVHIDTDAINCIALICTDHPTKLEMAIGVIDSVFGITHIEFVEFRSTFLVYVFNVISKSNSKSRIEFLKILTKAVFFHIRPYPNLELRKMYENSIFSSPNQVKRKRSFLLPTLRSLFYKYKTISRSMNNDNPIYSFSLYSDRTNGWADKCFVLTLIKFINEFYYSSMMNDLVILIYFYCQTQPINDCETLFPIIGQIIKEKNYFSYVVIKPLIRFRFFNFKQLNNETNSKPTSRPRRYSDLSPLVDNENKPSKRVKKSFKLPSNKSKERFGLIHKLTSSPLWANVTNENDDNSIEPMIDSENIMSIENLGLFIESFLSQNYSMKFFEIVIHTINTFCEARPNYVTNVHQGLFSDISSFAIVMQPKLPLNYVNKRFGYKYYLDIYNQFYLPKQNHLKRSSFIDNLMRPMLKTSHSSNAVVENIHFNEMKEEYEIRKDFNNTNELPAQRIKISKVINGIFYFNSTAIKFIYNTGKSIDLNLSDITQAFPMIILQRETAVEILTKHNQSFLFNFKSQKELKQFTSFIPSQLVTTDSLTEYTEKWQHHQISTFHYLLILNTLSGRSFNTAYSYPIFPWILADYTSQTLKLDDPSTFRDLSKPLGALNPTRIEKLKKLREDNFDGQDFLYRSTYSCAFYIYHYMVRLQPFTSLHVMMQDGKFDVASRLFTSIENSYERVTGTSHIFRELIPEFFFCPEFLINKDNIPFESDINNVELPPYAKSAPHFIYLNRQALESDYVSSHINEWIDLIWGYKQTGQNAIDNDNAFDPLLYSNVWKEHPNPNEKKQIEELLMHMGQIPLKLFDAAHPKRLLQTNQPFGYLNAVTVNTNHNAPIAAINFASSLVLHIDGRISKFNEPPKRCFFLDGCGCDPLNTMSFKNGFATIRKNSNAIYLIKDEQQQVVQYRKRHLSIITAVCAVGSRLFTGDMDGIVSSETTTITSLHKSPIVSIAGCELLSILVSLSKNGIVGVSHLNNLKFIRSFKLDIQPGFSPFKVVLCHEFGFICVVSIFKDNTSSIVSNFTINGEKIISVHWNIRITDIMSLSKTNGMDYLIVSDDKCRVHLINAFELTIIGLIAENEQNISSFTLIKKNPIQLSIGFDNGSFMTGVLSI